MRQSTPYCYMIGDFNAKSKDWCSIDTTGFEGSEFDFLTS